MTAHVDLDQRTMPVRDTGPLPAGTAVTGRSGGRAPAVLHLAVLSAGDTWGAGARLKQLPVVRRRSWLR